eukprot:CAMPEP_0117621538 /NCGR_PEP_ID=MMETSP0784-20121206/87684_1 /TAXON_ID=39447 /ORGANISM="" /LENGTH=84 /DNA_ID=CAMNT_0005425463 /DNA_START=425 /DNA_END=679 /DNA_ORIENTATION=+
MVPSWASPESSFPGPPRADDANAAVMGSRPSADVAGAAKGAADEEQFAKTSPMASMRPKRWLRQPAHRPSEHWAAAVANERRSW